MLSLEVIDNPDIIDEDAETQYACSNKEKIRHSRDSLVAAKPFKKLQNVAAGGSRLLTINVHS